MLTEAEMPMLRLQLHLLDIEVSNTKCSFVAEPPFGPSPAIMAHNPRQFSRNFASFAYCFLTP